MKQTKRRMITWLLILIMTVLTACQDNSTTGAPQTEQSIVTPDSIPAYQGYPYVEINGNEPEFTKEELTAVSYETYSELDSLGRCGPAIASIGKDLMPTQKREAIGMIKPSGWQTVKYDHVEGKYLYNRCHLIGFQLTAENANEKNLITGTRYMNTEGMLPFENETAEYIRETGNHVLYRVTPVFEGDNLVASGVQMEAYSVEDSGAGVKFNVYVYNVQPGITIDYKTGQSALDSNAGTTAKNTDTAATYIVNKNTYTFHDPSCSSVQSIKPQNKKEYKGERQKLIDSGYDPCSRCHP